MPEARSPQTGWHAPRSRTRSRSSAPGLVPGGRIIATIEIDRSDIASASSPAGSADATAPRPRPPGRVANALALFVATGAGSGYAPVASGTAGSAVGALLFWPLAALSLPLYLLTTAALACLGVWAADLACRHWQTVDDGRVVIDEIVGQLLTLAPLLPLGRTGSLGLIVTGFVAFRVYDVWKPGPVRWLEENLEGGAGVVMDDVLAGVLGAATVAAIALATG
jgi:phosphatidylglycerophosphatase A